MRLIDADAFDERVRIAVGFSEEEIPEDFKDGIATVLLLLKTQPTVDAVREGRWKKVSGYATPGGDPVWQCSECGKGLHVYGVEASTYGSDVADHQWVACPNCGVKMRENV